MILPITKLPARRLRFSSSDEFPHLLSYRHMPCSSFSARLDHMVSDCMISQWFAKAAMWNLPDFSRCAPTWTSASHELFTWSKLSFKLPSLVLACQSHLHQGLCLLRQPSRSFQILSSLAPLGAAAWDHSRLNEPKYLSKGWCGWILRSMRSTASSVRPISASWARWRDLRSSILSKAVVCSRKLCACLSHNLYVYVQSITHNLYT